MWISNEHNQFMLQTKDFKKNVKTMREHRNQIKPPYEFLEKNYKEHCNIVARKLREEDI